MFVQYTCTFMYHSDIMHHSDISLNHLCFISLIERCNYSNKETRVGNSCSKYDDRSSAPFAINIFESRGKDMSTCPK